MIDLLFPLKCIAFIPIAILWMYSTTDFVPRKPYIGKKDNFKLDNFKLDSGNQQITFF